MNGPTFQNAHNIQINSNR